MVIRFPLRPGVVENVEKKTLKNRIYPSRLNRIEDRSLNSRQIEHRERMLRHLQSLRLQ